MTTENNVVTASAFERARVAKAEQPKPDLQVSDLQVAKTYRAKRPAKAGDPLDPCINDRTIKWMGDNVVQYDSPAVAFGRRYPKVSIEAFIKWASHDVTDELPAGAYAPWPKGGKA